MFRYHLKIALRGFLRSKAYSALNILGLAIGMSIALLIGLWGFYQRSFDRFLPGYEHAYSVMLRSNNSGVIDVGISTPLPLADAIKQEVPGVQYVAQADWGGGHLLGAGDKKIFKSGIIAGSDFLKIFRYPLLKGSMANVMQQPNSIVLSVSAAKALFGGIDVIDKTIRLDDKYDLKVSGVLEDVPQNSSLQFSFIIPFSHAVQNDDGTKRNLTNWRNSSVRTFLSLYPSASYEQVSMTLRGLQKKYNPEDHRAAKTEVLLHPLKDWHLYNEFRNGVAAGGLIDNVKMFAIIGVLILVISCINFMNLTIARSGRRAKEVGVRKAIGSQRKNLVVQFLVESIVTTVVAFLVALLFVLVSLPAFNSLTQATVSIPFSNLNFWLLMITYILFTGVLAGSRPAFYLSSLKVTKGSAQVGKGASFSRRILVVMQFSCSVALIISTIVIFRQIQHAKERPAGYDVNRLVMTNLSGELYNQYGPLKNALLESGVVSAVTKSSSPVTAIWANQRIDNWEGKFPDESLGLSTVAVTDADYFTTMGMQFASGRNFTDAPGADSLDVILNEAAVKRMRFKDPLGQIITWHDHPQRVRVIGIVKDALMASPFAQAEPTIFAYVPEWSGVITYRLSADKDPQEAIRKISEIFETFNPAYPYEYHFVDQAYASKFGLETTIGKMAGLFATLAIIISCLGLFGLAAFMSEQRTKEIGVRKVLGASVWQVWLLLSTEFFILVIISCVIASPVAFYYLDDWLQRYEYRTNISPYVFLVSAITALVITGLTISFQAIKAATADPVKSLRTE